MSDHRKEKTGIVHKLLSGLGAVLCVILGFLLVCNLTIIIKGTVNPEEPPSVIGITPFVVLSGSMSGDAPDHIETGDLVFVTETEAEELEVGDVIAFMEGSVIVTHRIIEIGTDEEGGLQFITKGDANNAKDQIPVNPEDLVGIYKYRIPKLGDFALFLQTPAGMLIFIGVPLLGFIIYDIIRRQRYAGKESRRTAELEAELERLRRGETAPADQEPTPAPKEEPVTPPARPEPASAPKAEPVAPAVKKEAAPVPKAEPAPTPKEEPAERLQASELLRAAEREAEAAKLRMAELQAEVARLRVAELEAEAAKLRAAAEKRQTEEESTDI